MYNEYYGKCPNAHKASNELITLPIHLGITQEDIKRISNIINKVVK